MTDGEARTLDLVMSGFLTRPAQGGAATVFGMSAEPGQNDIFVGGIGVDNGMLAGPDAVIPTVILQVTGFAGLAERVPVHLRLHFQAGDIAALVESLQANAAQSVENALDGSPER